MQKTYLPIPNGQVFNLTFGQSRSITDLAQIIKSRFPGVRVLENPRDTLMPERGTLSIEKAKDLLGYRPRYSIEDGFSKYIDWYQDSAALKPDLFLS